MDFIFGFVFWYPLVMSLIWISGTFVYNMSWGKEKEIDIDNILWPKVSFLIPCYNEADTIEETIENISKLPYPNFEIIAINDGSKDNTGEIITQLTKKYHKLKSIDCKVNRGKANALHIGAHSAKSEYLICIDSDAILDEMAPYYLIKHFLVKGERVGAVTGNPRIRNRDTLLGKLQVIEYASIIGAIKRTQRVLGKIMTVSGVIVAFRKKALVDVGLWDRDMITEDIAISWKLQKKFWNIRYEPRALCWMLVPETLKGLWNQRVRWSQGGQEVLLRHYDLLFDWKQRRIWPVYIEAVLSTFWSFAFAFVTVYTLITGEGYLDRLLFLRFSAITLVITSHIQLLVSMFSDSVIDSVWSCYFYAAWYPSVYWLVNTFTVIFAFPRAVKSRIRGGFATWTSPDRGNR